LEKFALKIVEREVATFTGKSGRMTINTFG
jgi:hypothetical protein